MAHLRTVLLLLLATVGGTTLAAAQPLGTFRWQLQPYCNVVTVTVTQVGGVYRLEGTDNLCGELRVASAIGTAFLNPDGTVGIGLNVVSQGRSNPVAAVISLATLSGTWASEAIGGQFTFTPGPSTPGSPRPSAASVFPSTFQLTSSGGFVAGGTFQLGAIPSSGPGTRLMWYPGRAAIRAGRVDASAWDDFNVGNESAAFNKNTRATGTFSFAINDSTRAAGTASVATGFSTAATGNNSLSAGVSTTASGANSVATGGTTLASGNNSFAGGVGTVASGPQAVALGESSQAIGTHAVALGQGTQAAGNQSVALGLNTTTTGAHALAMGDGTAASGGNSVAAGAFSQASGFESVAMGLRVAAGGNGSVVLGSDAVTLPAATGSFIFADRSNTTDIVSFAPNEFIVRAAGGVGFYTNATATSGVEMAIGGSSWAPLSDANMKENFRDVPGEEVLAKLAGIPIREWNYTTQDSAIRHMGPTAQDFRAAFGLGDFPLRINTVDADGVALAAVKALEARTRELREENAQLRERLERLERLQERR